jgi:hypothetical protein
VLVLGAGQTPFAVPPAHAAPTTVDGDWSQIPFPPPSLRTRHSMIYDPIRNRMIVFGGLATGGRTNDVWELALAGTPTWKRLATSGTAPTPRFGHAAAYDPVRDRMILIGGDDGGPLADVWTLSLTGAPAWSQIAPTGTPPSARAGHAAVYDPVRDRVLVIGGEDGVGFQNDVWALSLPGAPSWAALSPSGTPPAPRARHTASYDSARDRVVVFGGADESASMNDVWTLALPGSPSWSEILPTGTPPPARYGHTAIYDTPRDGLVVFGGNDEAEPLGSQAWRLAFAPSASWALLSPSGMPPAGRYDHAAAYDSAGDRMLVFGGFTELPVNDLASLSLSGSTSWSAIAPLGGPPSPRTGHAVVLDPVRDRMLLIGGAGVQIQQDTWAMSFTGATWTQLAPSGPPLPARYGHVAVYDALRDRVLVFGGLGNSGYLNDTWALSLSGPGSPAWSELSTAGGPPSARYASAGVYDPAGDRLVIFGGLDDGGKQGEIWSLSLAGTPTWSQLSPSGTPPAARFLHSAVRLPGTNEMLIFAGTDSSLYSDAWLLSLSGPPAWTALAPSGSPPAPRYSSTTVYDDLRQRVVVFGGFDGFANRGDTWSLDLSGSPAWTLLLPGGSAPTPRYGHGAVYDGNRDRMLVFGGIDTQFQDDTWDLAWGGATGVDADAASEPRGRVLLRPAFPNPFGIVTTLLYELPSARPGRIAIYDVRGRVVRVLQQGALAKGTGMVHWDGRDGRGLPVASGTYFCRLETAGAAEVRKLVFLR